MAKSEDKNKFQHGNKTAADNPVNAPDLTLAGARDNDQLWYKIRVLLYDLQNPKKDRACQNRTLQTTDPLYIRAPYFTAEEATAVKRTIVETDAGITTLEPAISSSLENFFEKRRASGDSRPCGPHDMVPVYLASSGMDKAEIADENFFARLRRSGLGTK